MPLLFVPYGVQGWVSQLVSPMGGVAEGSRCHSWASNLSSVLWTLLLRKTVKSNVRFKKSVALVQDEVIMPWPTR